jgi:hypothetical protein
MHQVVVASFQPEQQKSKKQMTDLGVMKPIMSPAGLNSAFFSNGQGSGNSSSSADDEHV